MPGQSPMSPPEQNTPVGQGEQGDPKAASPLYPGRQTHCDTLTAPMGDVAFSGHDQIAEEPVELPPVPFATRFTCLSCGTIGVYPCTVRLALVAADAEEFVKLLGTMIETAKPSFAV